LIAGFGLAFTLAAGTAQAQLAPFNDLGVTMGHWHLISKDLAANKKIFLGMGGQAVAGAETVTFPGVRINLNLGTETGAGGTVGSVVNHVGFIVNNVQEQVAKWKANGVAVLPGANGRLDQAYVETPDGLRIEILENKAQRFPIQHEHVHFFLPEAAISQSQAWYGKIFGAKATVRNNAPVADIPGMSGLGAKVLVWRPKASYSKLVVSPFGPTVIKGAPRPRSHDAIVVSGWSPHPPAVRPE